MSFLQVVLFPHEHPSSFNSCILKATTKQHIKMNANTWYSEGKTIAIRNLNVFFQRAGAGDAQQLPPLLEQVKGPVNRVGGDGAYDTYEIWELLRKKEIEGLIPPQENAIYWVDEKDSLLDLDRNKILQQIDRKSRKRWKQESGYHRRSLSETAMYRFKTIFGPELKSRKLKSQQTEAAIKIACLNKMTKIGMPISQKIA
jgi:hypothetical protein